MSTPPPQPLFLDTNGLQPLPPQAWQGAPDVLGVWNNPYGHAISVHYYPMVPDLPAAPDDIHLMRPALAARYAPAGCLVEADQAVVDGVRGVRLVMKEPLPNAPSGLVFGGVIVLPRDRCSVVAKIQAAEQGMTGQREAMVMARIGPGSAFPPHPYQPGLQGRLPYAAADATEYDDEFPNHPLSVVRRVLAHMVATARVDPMFRDLPDFAPPR